MALPQKKKKKILPSLPWALDLSARGISQHSLTLGVIKYLNRNRQKWWDGWSLSEINGSYECEVSDCNQKNVEGQKKRLKIDLRKVGIKQNLKKIQRIQGGWRKENWIEWESGYAQRMFQGEVREGHGAER